MKDAKGKTSDRAVHVMGMSFEALHDAQDGQHSSPVQASYQYSPYRLSMLAPLNPCNASHTPPSFWLCRAWCPGSFLRRHVQALRGPAGADMCAGLDSKLPIPGLALRAWLWQARLGMEGLPIADEKQESCACIVAALGMIEVVAGGSFF